MVKELLVFCVYYWELFIQKKKKNEEKEKNIYIS